MRQAFLVASLLSMASATLIAQRPGGPPAGRGVSRGAIPANAAPGFPRAAEMLLSHTGELELTDAQVTRLAAIARRSEARRRAMRVAMDSGRVRFQGQPGDTAARRQFAQRLRTQVQQERELARVDQRDAIAVLNADQQAKAWGLVARRGAPRGGAGVGRVGGRGTRQMRDMRPGVRGPMGLRRGGRPSGNGE